MTSLQKINNIAENKDLTRNWIKMESVYSNNNKQEKSKIECKEDGTSKKLNPAE